jgi:hypothetical protein
VSRYVPFSIQLSRSSDHQDPICRGFTALETSGRGSSLCPSREPGIITTFDVVGDRPPSTTTTQLYAQPILFTNPAPISPTELNQANKNKQQNAREPITQFPRMTSTGPLSPRFWAAPITYIRWAARERPAYFWSVVIGATGPVMLVTVPPIRRWMGAVPYAPVPMTYPGMSFSLSLSLSFIHIKTHKHTRG